MSILGSFSFVRLLRTLHGWLGFFVLPWIIVIGLTEIYLNHSKLVLSYLPDAGYDEARFDDWPNPISMSRDVSEQIAKIVLGERSFRLRDTDIYHDREVWWYRATDGADVIFTKATGHYWVKEGYTRKTYDPDGRLLATKYYWGSLFKSLHTRGWISGTYGTWLADITAGAMVLFGLSGIILFLSPRLRRRKSRKAAKVTAAPAAARSPAPPPQTVPRSTPRPRRIKLD